MKMVRPWAAASLRVRAGAVGLKKANLSSDLQILLVLIPTKPF